MSHLSNPKRQSIRLKGYDYSQPGGYFVTICTHKKVCVFGEITSTILVPNKLGKVVQESWLWLEKRYSYIELDEWILMPNHIHGIIFIHGNQVIDKPRRGGSRAAPTNHYPLYPYGNQLT